MRVAKAFVIVSYFLTWVFLGLCVPERPVTGIQLAGAMAMTFGLVLVCKDNL